MKHITCYKHIHDYIQVKVKVKSLSRVQLFGTPWTVAHQATPSMGFSRQKYWSGLPFPSPGDLPDPGIEPRSPRQDKADFPPQCRWTSSSALRAWLEEKRWRKGEFSRSRFPSLFPRLPRPHLLSLTTWAGTLTFSCPQTGTHHRGAWFSGLQTWTETTPRVLLWSWLADGRLWDFSASINISQFLTSQTHTPHTHTHIPHTHTHTTHTHTPHTY